DVAGHDLGDACAIGIAPFGDHAHHEVPLRAEPDQAALLDDRRAADLLHSEEARGLEHRDLAREHAGGRTVLQQMTDEKHRPAPYSQKPGKAEAVPETSEALRSLAARAF